MQITFRVPVPLTRTDGPPEVRWLAADGTLVVEEEEGASFTLNAFPTMGEQAQIRRRCHELAGGLQAWVETAQALQGARAIAAQAEDDAQRNAALAAASELEDMLAMVDFQASWEVLAVDVPDGWESLLDRRLPPLVSDSLRRAHEVAAEGVLLGNAPPSAG